ncbi:hypothetical protein OH76DRAFT_819695 [Lentinus brumalis]|uniref:Uncharacterized protein n=1 Tax=Lentinus brumalis TaxID=2498619 RepID=A0A371D2R1_9APHY|nr:hypothetical protein OH76DRAFT_819695 [Polyporus brumalis]
MALKLRRGTRKPRCVPLVLTDTGLSYVGSVLATRHETRCIQEVRGRCCLGGHPFVLARQPGPGSSFRERETASDRSRNMGRLAGFTERLHFEDDAPATHRSQHSVLFPRVEARRNGCSSVPHGSTTRFRCPSSRRSCCIGLSSARGVSTGEALPAQVEGPIVAQGENRRPSGEQGSSQVVPDYQASGHGLTAEVMKS